MTEIEQAEMSDLVLSQSRLIEVQRQLIDKQAKYLKDLRGTFVWNVFFALLMTGCMWFNGWVYGQRKGLTEAVDIFKAAQGGTVSKSDAKSDNTSSVQSEELDPSIHVHNYCTDAKHTWYCGWGVDIHE